MRSINMRIGVEGPWTWIFFLVAGWCWEWILYSSKCILRYQQSMLALIHLSGKKLISKKELKSYDFKLLQGQCMEVLGEKFGDHLDSLWALKEIGCTFKWMSGSTGAVAWTEVTHRHPQSSRLWIISFQENHKVWFWPYQEWLAIPGSVNSLVF